MLVTPGQAGGVLAGLSRATLQANLAAAQQAYNDLMTGAKVVTASYTQGDGSKSVTYTQTSMINLRSYIEELQRALGISNGGRRPMRPFFR
ncbi:gpW family head-tail joining protein [Rhizosaccharibacter radicis]|uniref:GpW family protein n=1 Tax=Rhizosaccharibacter radicis TaxID=2782605 RepID=A0ABT1VWG3_9PROT|nr:gpW family protein [Acetobacteraceae bacterium KSS12]